MRQRTSQTKTRPAKKTSVRAEEFVYERKGKRERERDGFSRSEGGICCCCCASEKLRRLLKIESTAAASAVAFGDVLDDDDDNGNGDTDVLKTDSFR